MTHITMRVAMWERGLVLVPADEDAHLFADTRFEVMHVDGCMVFIPTDQGIVLRLRRCTHSRPCLLYEFTYEESWELPRFTLHEVELSLDEDGSMTWCMPDLYELPWTIAQGLSADQKTVVAERELTLRVQSAAGDVTVMQTICHRVPNWARSAVRPERWLKIFMGV